MLSALVHGLSVLVALGAFSIAHASPKTQRIAVIVGNNAGGAKEETLRYAEEEAMAVYKLLIDIGGVQTSNAYLLMGKSAKETRAALEEVKARITDIRRDGNALLIFYYSGHASENALHQGNSRLDLKELKSYLSGVNADTTIAIVDSCQSGALTRTKGVKVLPAYDVSINDPSTAVGQIFITSSGASEVSIEDEGLKGSVFSHYLISGLRGDADSDADGRIDLDELYKYTYHSTVAKTVETPVSQHPRFDYDLRGAGSLILSWPEKSNARLTIGPDMPGTYLIASKYKRRVLAEVTLQSTQTKTIALPSQRYLIKQRVRGGFRVGEVNLTWGGAKKLDVSAMRHVSYEPVAHKGLLPTSDLYTVAAALRVRNGVIDGNALLIGPAVSMRRRLRTSLQLHLDLAFVAGQTETLDFSVRTRGLSAELGATYLLDIEPLQLGLGAFAGPLMFWQHIPELEDRGSVGLSSGLMSSLSWTVADPFVIIFGLRTGVEYVKRGQSYGPRVHASTDLGVGMRF